MAGGQHIRANGLDFWVEQQGRGPALLLITGLGYASWFWRELAEALGDEFHVIRFDNRGTGRSDKPPGPYSIEQMADDAAAILAACGVARAHVMGHSMGGYIAQTLARRHASLLQSLVLVSTAAGGPGATPLPEETLAVWTQASALPPAQHARMSMPLSFSPGWTEANAERFEAYLKLRLEFPTPVACWRAQYAACEAFFAVDRSHETLCVPSLVIHGTEDRVLPYANSQHVLRALPDAQLQRLDGFGHLPPLEDPALFSRITRAFLQRA